MIQNKTALWHILVLRACHVHPGVITLATTSDSWASDSSGLSGVLSKHTALLWRHPSFKFPWLWVYWRPCWCKVNFTYLPTVSNMACCDICQWKYGINKLDGHTGCKFKDSMERVKGGHASCMDGESQSFSETKNNWSSAGQGWEGGLYLYLCWWWKRSRHKKRLCLESWTELMAAVKTYWRKMMMMMMM